MWAYDLPKKQLTDIQLLCDQSSGSFIEDTSNSNKAELRAVVVATISSHVPITLQAVQTREFYASCHMPSLPDQLINFSAYSSRVEETEDEWE